MYFFLPLRQSQVGGSDSKTILFSLNNALTSNADGNTILLTCVLSEPLLSHLFLFLWDSGIVSQLSKTDFIPTIASQYTLSILGLTETWIRPEDSTPAALYNYLPFSHTPRQVGRVLVFSFLITGNTQPTLPYAIIIILNFMLLR